MRIVFNGAAIALTFLSLLLLSPVTFSEKCNPQDKKVLLIIKQELNNPYLLASWDPKTDCCDWYCVEHKSLRPHLPIHRNSSISYHLTKSVQSSSPHHLTSIHSAVSNSNSLYNAPSYNGYAPSATSQPLADLAFSSTSATGQAPASIMAIDDLFGLDFSVGTATKLPPSPLTLNPKAVLDPGTFQQKWHQLPISLSEEYSLSPLGIASLTTPHALLRHMQSHSIQYIASGGQAPNFKFFFFAQKAEEASIYLVECIINTSSAKSQIKIKVDDQSSSQAFWTLFQSALSKFEPEMEERKLMGFKWIFVLSLALLQAAYYRRLRWSVLKSRKLVLDVVN
ncbi:hypothetical protein RYX36_007019 [Vicia faba]